MEGIIAAPKRVNHDGAKERRTGNYKPNIWDSDFVQSIHNKFSGETYKRRVEKQKDYVRQMLINNKEMVPLAQLHLIHDLQRLGLKYHFEKEIKEALDALISFININNGRISGDDDLHSTALCFRQLRQHGYFVSQDLFSSFMDDTGNFMTSLSQDFKGMLGLYEASHLAIEGENMMENAKAFSSKILKDLKGNMDPYLNEEIAHALEVPSHCRVPWSEARWYINAYERRENINPTLLELAKLSFNMVQATHQGELKEIYGWWKNEGLGEKLSFARQRLVECFLWSVGTAFEPQYGCLRKWLTKIINLILLIDDIYDIYGSLDELEQFTDAVESWEDKKIDHLPDYMKICFVELHGTTNEISSGVQKDQNRNIMVHLKKVWTDFCKSLLVEAKWYNSGYSPSLQEYLDNAWISSSGAILIIHSYFALAQETSNDGVGFLETNRDLVYHPSMIIRLCNDLGTSAAELERGDAPSSILCYMREAEVSEEIAREHIKDMIVDTWKKMNEKCISHSSHFPPVFLNFTYNVARVAHFIYQYGDGFGVQDRETRNNVLSLLVQPIQLHLDETDSI
ncbi:alpha-farnesene synthase-like [Telopea speciosissima]|uniref:alpha-farnesene synthase-like n=1 Tax=Telopea speciosissima TaxID=54955 RepID=UPI001CC81778|nr:alpha-farnesene synthase-like [Telopea speciosissima]